MCCKASATWWSQDGLPSEPQQPQPGGPQDEPSGAPDHNLSLSTDLLHSQPGGPPQDGLLGAPDDDYQYDNDDDLTYLVENAEFEEINIETIAGNKKGSLWLIVNNQYICVKNDESASGKSESCQ